VTPWARNSGVGSVSGGEPDVHVDLEASTVSPRFFAVRFVFEDGNLDCPETRWALTVSNGVLSIHHLNVPPIEPSTGQMKTDLSDDLTYRLQYFRLNCRADIAIRQQVRSGGEWKSLLVPEARGPSLSKEARQEAIRRNLDALGLPTTDPKQLTQSDIDRINEMLKSPAFAEFLSSVGNAGRFRCLRCEYWCAYFTHFSAHQAAGALGSRHGALCFQGRTH